MASRFIDLTNQKFTRLTVISLKEITSKHVVMWNCKCDCGKELIVRTSCLRTKNTQSCGCLLIDSATKHGHNKSQTSKPTPTYVCWQGMIQRCYDKNFSRYYLYGGRGIEVCDRWRDFRNFLADMGEKPDKMSIDRYPNNDGNYEPSNCRWATMKQQGQNRRTNKLLIHNGESKSVSEWAEIMEVPRSVFQDRIRLGWSDSAIITTPYTPRTKQR